MQHVYTVFGVALLGLSTLAQAEDGIEAREAAARQAAQTFMQELKSKLTSAIKAGGPENAIQVCSEIAPQIAGRLSRENGWRVTRVGTRVRNPALGLPDAWEQKTLAQFAEQVEAGESLETMSHSEVVEEPDGQYFRFMKAIGTAEQCLACHGASETIAAPVRAGLNERYPFDQATGYRAGELRGAVSIKQPLDLELLEQAAEAEAPAGGD